MCNLSNFFSSEIILNIVNISTYLGPFHPFVLNTVLLFSFFKTDVYKCILLTYRHITLHYMLLVRRFYPKRLTYSILWAIPTGAIWGEVCCPGTQRHADCSGV